MKGNVTGRMPAYNFLDNADRQAEGIIDKNIQPELKKAVDKRLHKIGWIQNGKPPPYLWGLSEPGVDNAAAKAVTNAAIMEYKNIFHIDSDRAYSAARMLNANARADML